MSSGNVAKDKPTKEKKEKKEKKDKPAKEKKDKADKSAHKEKKKEKSEKKVRKEKPTKDEKKDAALAETTTDKPDKPATTDKHHDSEKKIAKPKPKKKVDKKSLGTVKKVPLKITIDCTEPHNDDIFDMASFEKFLHEKMKVNGKTGVLGDNVTITKEASSIHVTSKVQNSKRYLKYLTKKFLKKQQLRDYIRVIARQKNNYYLRYFNFQADEQEED